MKDDFLERLQADWQGGEAGPQRIGRRVRRDLWAARAMLASEVLVAILALCASVWMIGLGLDRREPLFLLAAAFLIVALPPLTVLSWKARRPSLHWEDMTPEGVADYALARLDRSERLVVLTRRHLYVLAAFVAAIGMAVAFNLARPSLFLALYVGAIVVMIAGGLWLLRRRQARIARERARCEQIRAELGRETG